MDGDKIVVETLTRIENKLDDLEKRVTKNEMARVQVWAVAGTVGTVAAVLSTVLGLAFKFLAH